MEVIARYTGEEFTPSSQRSNDLLAKLAEKAKKRSLQALEANHPHEENDKDVCVGITNGHDAHTASSKKRRKKLKLLVEEVEEEAVAVEGDHSRSSRKQKKKSKRERSSVEEKEGIEHAVLDVADASGDENCNEQGKGKRKKKKKLNDPEPEVNCVAVCSTESFPRKKRKNGSDFILPPPNILEDDAAVSRIVESASNDKKKRKKIGKKAKASGQLGNEQGKAEEGEPTVPTKKLKKKRKNATKQKLETAILVENGEFTVIGQEMNLKLQEVSSFLPEWLRKPITFSVDLHDEQLGVEQLAELHPNIIATLKESNIHRLFPVQACLVPWMLRACRPGAIRPNDVCVSAPTGSGKTLAFVLPIVNTLRVRVVRKIRALVVLPVHELAIQVFKVFKSFCGKNNNLDVGLAAGADSLEGEQHALVRRGFRQYHSLVDILVCTPGRLVDHIQKTKGFTLKDLRFLVIDEADRMMEQIKHGWLQKVEQCVLGANAGCSIPIAPSRLPDLQCLPQKLLFSATLSHDPEKLEMMKLFQPKLFISVSDQKSNVNSNGEASALQSSVISRLTLPKELTQFSCVCTAELKPLVLLHLLHNKGYRHVLCFTNSKTTNSRLASLLSSYGGLQVVEFSSLQGNEKRREQFDRFKAGLVDVIVCTDAMARGIDIEDVECVISYDMPIFAITYVHRVGRTARAGRAGTTISLLMPNQELRFSKIMSAAGIMDVSSFALSQSELEPLVPKYEAALQKVAQDVKTESIRKIKRSR